MQSAKKRKERDCKRAGLHVINFFPAILHVCRLILEVNRLVFTSRKVSKNGPFLKNAGLIFMLLMNKLIKESQMPSHLNRKPTVCEQLTIKMKFTWMAWSAMYLRYTRSLSTSRFPGYKRRENGKRAAKRGA